MGRPRRAAAGGLVYHVLNRANARLRVFHDDGDYAAFERVLAEAVDRTHTRLLAYCLMPNHWHLVVWPRADGELSAFAGWLGLTHTQRWHAHRHTAGRGHLYQGRFKSFPVQDDAHYLTVVRYVERDALRAKLVTRAEAWRWSSLHWYAQGAAGSAAAAGGDDGPADPDVPPLSEGPLPRPADWLAWVNAPQTAAEEAAVALSIRRGRPFGDDRWRDATADRLGLQLTLRPRGRPRRATRRAD